MTITSAQITAVLTLLSGGVLVKVIERYFFNRDANKKQASDLESQFLEENAKLKLELFNRVEKLEKQIETWRERYGNLYNEAQDQKDTYRSLKRDYEELKEMHQELKTMHEELKLVHDKREQDYEELRLQHEQLLQTCDDLRTEVTRFEKQVNKDIKEVREEVASQPSL